MNWGEVDEREQIGCGFATCASPSARKPRAACTLDAQGARGQRATRSSRGHPDPPIGGRQHASCPAIGESARLGRGAFPRVSRAGCRARGQVDRVPYRAPAPGHRIAANSNSCRACSSPRCLSTGPTFDPRAHFSSGAGPTLSVERSLLYWLHAAAPGARGDLRGQVEPRDCGSRSKGKRIQLQVKSARQLAKTSWWSSRLAGDVVRQAQSGHRAQGADSVRDHDRDAMAADWKIDLARDDGPEAKPAVRQTPGNDHRFRHGRCGRLLRRPNQSANRPQTRSGPSPERCARTRCLDQLHMR